MFIIYINMYNILFIMCIIYIYIYLPTASSSPPPPTSRYGPQLLMGRWYPSGAHRREHGEVDAFHLGGSRGLAPWARIVGNHGINNHG